MDEHGPSRSETEALAARTAAAVQALRTRAKQALDDRRQQLAVLEKRMTTEFESVCRELAEESENGRSAAGEELNALNTLRTELQQEQAAWSKLRQQQEAELTAARQAMEARESELAARDAELSEQSANVAAKFAEVEKLQEALAGERAELEAAREALEKEQRAATKAESEQIAELERQLEQQQATWHDERQQLAAELDDRSATIKRFRGEMAEMEQRLSEMQESSRAELAAAIAKQAEQEQAWQTERAESATQRESLATELKAAREQLAAARQEDSTSDAELRELRQKFELALEDVQRLRVRAAELEQELASRPKPDDAIDKEARELRADRDALLERVAELETSLEQSAGSQASEEIDDLRRRFEMAVDDVRQLKTEKAKLEEELAVARRASAAGADTGATDWEAQKRRLLASLDVEDSPSPERKKERASIEDTVRITDEVVAEKDREIAALQQQLEEANPESGADQILNADEIIRAERERLAALEVELNEKLRAAELELSVGRAKITRQQGELEQQKMELEALKKSIAGPAENGSGTHAAVPKRRWLSKLGLGGDDDG